MKGYNRVIVGGNVVRDAEMKVSQNGKNYAKISVAVNSAYKNADGTLNESVMYVPVMCWGKLAEIADKYFKKGVGLLIEGKLHIYNATNPDGTKTYHTDVIAESFQFTGTKKGEVEETDAPF